QTVTLTVARTGGLGASLVVNWTAGEGTATPGVDFTPASGSFTFATNSLTASFTINLLNDGFIEGTEMVPITLSVPDAAATLGPQST
ncbi:Calx-beta domain-containing protein, partial [Escherichia coli]|uniref:Calx-beta domain-containing protein n=1 Tax=Escherichia coli TaxID=562 RepID=UPI0028DE7153